MRIYDTGYRLRVMGYGLRVMGYRLILVLVLVLSLFTFHLSLCAQDYSLRFYDDSDGLSHWHTTCTIQDSTGMIWIATYNGLNRFDGYSFVSFKAADADGLSMPSDRIRKMELTADNNILCLIDDDNVALFNTRTCRFEELEPKDKMAAIARLRVHHNPNLWKEKAVYSDLGNLHLKNIRKDFQDRQGNHWLIDDHGIFVATPVHARGTRINDEEVRAMIQLKNGAILASGRSSKQVMVYDSAFHLLGYVHPDGRLGKTPASFGDQPYCFYESRDGKHSYIGCKPGCLIRSDNNPVHPNLTRYEYVRNIYEVAEDTDGTIWAATFSFGLWKQQGEHFVQIPGTENMSIRRLLILDDNTVLAATTKGLLIVDKRGIRLHQREGNRPTSLSSNIVMCMCMFHGQLYVGTEGGGINLLTSNDLHADVLEFKHITEADGLHTDIINDIMPWSENELLIQGNSALSIVRVTGDGLQVTNYGKSFFQTPDRRPFILGETWPVDLGDGRILIAPLDGLLVLNKSELVPETDPVRIALSTIYLEGKPNYAVDKLTRITLAPNERSVGIQFAALDYRESDETLYQTHFYKEGNKDHPWDAPTRLNQFLVQDLTPGNYIFEVRSTNALGQWQQNTRRLQITVTPTFWESTAGWVLQIGLLILITVCITVQTVRVRMHRKQRAEMLEAYLDLQERYLLICDQQKAGEQKTAEPLPVPEILVPGHSSVNEKFLSTLHQFMEQHISDNNLSIDEIAEVTNMSRSSLNRKMHELFNLSAKDFVQAARIKHACNLLRTTDLAAKEVAYACGFSDPRYFSKSFKANTGMTPTEYRESATD